MRNIRGEPVKPENLPKPPPTDQERIAALEAEVKAFKASLKAKQKDEAAE